MFSLIRRISHSVIPRPDRPWQDDPTSNAPQTGRKRRLSSTDREHDADDEESSKKKVRGESAVSTPAEEVESAFAEPPSVETEAVKEVTLGVKDVELGDRVEAAPEAIPLPEEESGELDEPAPGASPAPEGDSSVVQPEATQTVEGINQPTDEDDVASSDNEEESLPLPSQATKATPSTEGTREGLAEPAQKLDTSINDTSSEPVKI